LAGGDGGEGEDETATLTPTPAYRQAGSPVKGEEKCVKWKK